ncbi:iron-responsive transcriptional regulator RirA [Pararhizobium sp.]|uniref:iron-responsive transcriptional regulator RirA n=1 Tax=Pararhizobium sp. TaxID=1977563 RepID=UPI00271CB4BD|nr:iron-responsive transcriptional regulator RirA [Pararhizobium sp.]MDO9418309.1 iron-responsive transcriptional regulator RirA [Pararhizobium sp.]
MRLTKQTNYAIRMLMYCAANGEKLSRIPEIARAYGVSELFLFKILQPLTKAGLIETVRGRNGGVRLPRPASQINLFDIVKVTEENFAMAECFENDAAECPLVDSCGLNSALRKALNAFFAVLQEYTIDDLVRARPQINFLLGLEPNEMMRQQPAA